MALKHPNGWVAVEVDPPTQAGMYSVVVNGKPDVLFLDEDGNWLDALGQPAVATPHLWVPPPPVTGWYHPQPETNP